MVSKMKKLIRESEWLKVYQTDVGQHYESKLLHGSVPVESIIKRWGSLTAEEKWEIALGLQLRATLEPHVVPLVDYLLEKGDLVVRSTLAPLLTMHPRRQEIVHFLISQVRNEMSHRANYFQSLALIGDTKAVPALTEIHEQMQKTVNEVYANLSVEQASDFIACSEALWKLTRLEQFRAPIEKLATHPNAAVRNMASVSIRSGR